MHYGAIKNCDIANGVGVRVTLFVSGCTNRCEGCFQPETWDFHYGQPFTEETEAEILKMLAPAFINGLTLLGGEPMEPCNQKALLPFLKKVKAAYPNKTVWIFTGFTYEQLVTEGSKPCCAETREILSLTDVLVDGRYVASEKDLRLRFRGSRNQRLIDVPASLAAGTPVLWDTE